MDFFLYWFMFPVAIIVSTISMMSGIAGTALFMPIFLLIFPLLGGEYLLNSPIEAVTSALLTSTFGFASGLIAYQRRGLIDYNIAKSFLKYSLIASTIGAIICFHISADALRAIYAIMTLGLAYYILTPDLVGKLKSKAYTTKTKIDRSGNAYDYFNYKARPDLTGIGGLMTGLLSVGIGETTMTQLIKIAKIPFPVAAATSVLVVIATMFSAALVQVIQLSIDGGITAVPWHLVAYTIPGVIVGGQIGPRLQGTISSQTMQKAIAYLFIFIGLIMILTIL